MIYSAYFESCLFYFKISRHFNILHGILSSCFIIIVGVVQLLSHVRLFAPPGTVACQDSLSFTIFWNLLKFMSIESVMLSNHLFLCHPLLLPSIFPSISVFSNVLALTLSGQSTGASASELVLPMSIQGWFPLGLTGLISLLSKGLSRVFSSTTIWKHHIIIF